MMRNKNNKYHRQPQQQQEQHHYNRSMFLPMLCSSSSKEVKLSHRRCSSTSSSLSEDPSSPRVGCMGQVKRNNKVVGFPTIIGFITTNSGNHATGTTTSALKKEHNINSSINSSSTISIVKYHKLKRFFSAKSLPNSPTATVPGPGPGPARAARVGIHKPKSSVRIVNINREREIGDDRILCRSKIQHENSGSISISNSQSPQKGCSVNLEELDPPLPVVKRVQKQEQEEGNKGENLSLWKRRSGGAPLKGLQVQVVNQSPALLPASTV